MHGRLKVRSTEEEAARRKKQQDEKRKLFQAAMARIKQKKAADECDEEMMELTWKLLEKNPDIATLWNLRRLCILQQQQQTNTEAAEVQAVFDKDLRFTEICLHVNPKSYCVWHHRCWVLNNAPHPNWQTEVDLCTQYLKKDERNFHCWDYRRYVVEKAQVTAEKEFEFCTEKIQKNFSNYSSWHYRSNLLPILFPNEADPNRPIGEEKLKEELELVLTAAFTDPNDSSAWFYQRWLLGYSQPELAVAAFRIDDERGLCAISFTKAIDLRNGGYRLTTPFCKVLEELNNWQPVNPTGDHDATWYRKGNFRLDGETESKVELVCPDGATHGLPLAITDGGVLMGVNKPSFGYVFGSTVVDVLRTQLESCEQLLEYEPDSKWTLLTAALLMKAIDSRGYFERIRENLLQLQSVDSMRKGYYRDLVSKWAIENRLERWLEAGDLRAKMDLSGLGLTMVCYEQYLAVADEVDLSANELEDRNLLRLKALVFCRKLNVTGNHLQAVDDAQKNPDDVFEALRKSFSNL